MADDQDGGALYLAIRGLSAFFISLVWLAMSASSQPRRVLIVDDHAFMRQGLRSFIERDSGLTICAEAGCCAEALHHCRESRPDLALIDLLLGNESGLDLVKDIAAQFPSIRMLVLSMQDELLYAERVLRAGASGYISKDVPPDRLTAAVRCVLGGDLYASDAVQQKFMKAMRSTGAPDQDPIHGLSDRELEVFAAIGRGLSTAAIAEAMHLSVKTVETYRSRIKAKLNIETSAGLVRRAVQWALDQPSASGVEAFHE